MNILEFKKFLSQINEVVIIQPNGKLVPPHFHVTELGIISKHYIDCGGTIRKEKVANFQLWNADDIEHRIEPKKIIDIIEIAEHSLGLENLEIEVYDHDVVGADDFMGRVSIPLGPFTDKLWHQVGSGRQNPNM